jgi:hypothetical protein
LNAANRSHTLIHSWRISTPDKAAAGAGVTSGRWAFSLLLDRRRSRLPRGARVSRPPDNLLRALQMDVPARRRRGAANKVRRPSYGVRPSGRACYGLCVRGAGSAPLVFCAACTLARRLGFRRLPAVGGGVGRPLRRGGRAPPPPFWVGQAGRGAGRRCGGGPRGVPRS